MRDAAFEMPRAKRRTSRRRPRYGSERAVTSSYLNATHGSKEADTRET
jgi:hypothetical protein